MAQCQGTLDPDTKPVNAIEVHFINIGPFVTGGGGEEGESILIRNGLGSN